MKLTMTMALVAGTAWAGSAVPEGAVTVCLHRPADTLTLFRAQAAASKMFATAGVKIDWREPRSCPAGAIVVSLSENAAASDHPGALAYALPYEGTHIVVFFSRIQIKTAVVDPNLFPMLLAHVLVHEITHILQGVNRHSDTGVMKAHWDSADFGDMRIKPLSFTALDVDLIHRGVDGRSSIAALAAGNSTPATAQ